MGEAPVTGTPQGKHLERALAVAGLGGFEWDMARDVVVFNDQAAAILGVAAGEHAADEGRGWDAYVHPDDREGALAAGREMHRREGKIDAEMRYIRPDGRTIWIRITGVQELGPTGAPAALIGIIQDVTERRLEESQRETLMAELDHRVKNVLATVQALAFQTAKGTTSLDIFLRTFAGRLKSMASANELLTAARWRGAAVDHLAAAELGGVAPNQTRWEGPEVFLTPRAANALALALHELVTNALKYGALSTDKGRVDVRWTRLPAGGFELTWDESGGPYVRPPTHRGFGSTLLNHVTGRELNGETSVEYRPGGVHARLRAGPAAVIERPASVPEVAAPRIVETIPAASAPTDLKGARVLIVEDAVLLALELETGLQEAGAEVIGPAYELEEAMALLAQPIDAAVLDANLNGRSVTPVAEVLSARGVPFVFATGYGESGGAPTGMDAPIIRKPYDVTQVAAAVAALLKPA